VRSQRWAHVWRLYNPTLTLWVTVLKLRVLDRDRIRWGGSFGWREVIDTPSVQRVKKCPTLESRDMRWRGSCLRCDKSYGRRSNGHKPVRADVDIEPI